MAEVLAQATVRRLQHLEPQWYASSFESLRHILLRIIRISLITYIILSLNTTLPYSSLTSGEALHFATYASVMPYFRITLIRSGIGLPRATSGVLRALGLHKRMRTVFHPVSPQVAGQIMKVKELVAVSEVERPMTKQEVHDARKPDAGFWIESAVPR